MAKAKRISTEAKDKRGLEERVKVIEEKIHTISERLNDFLDLHLPPLTSPDKLGPPSGAPTPPTPPPAPIAHVEYDHYDDWYSSHGQGD